MTTQDLWTALLLVPALALGVVGAVASRRGRTTLGLSPRHGAMREFLGGCAFSLPVFAVFLALMDLSGVASAHWQGGWGTSAGLAVYFLVLFLLEEIAFRALLMTGLGVLLGPPVALVLTAVLVAGAYAFAPHTGLLPVLGAVVTNLLTGLARWRTGRIWWGLGQRWLWNSALVAAGFTDSAYSLEDPVLRQQLTGPRWVTGGSFGIEGGLIGIVVLLLMIGGVVLLARGRSGPWTVTPAHAPGGASGQASAR